MLTPMYTVGFVYVLTNDSMPGLVKIGYTSRLTEDRAQDLYQTNIPEPYKIAYRTTTSWYREVESRVHVLLNEYRINASREFFRISVDKAINAVRLALIETASIDSWKGLKHTFATGDRAALTLKAGQIFVVINYESCHDVMADNAKVIDFWQSHSDGDVLEIYATDSATHVSGFSDGDSGGTDDPVPYIDRDKNIANSVINGRERLMSGERLVWLPAPEDVKKETSVVFESQNYCQIISRTSTPVIGSHGLPLLLNDFLLRTELWHEANRLAVHSALELPAPRNWSPRQNRDSSWETIGSDPPTAEYWLKQLKKTIKKPRKGKN